MLASLRFWIKLRKWHHQQWDIINNMLRDRKLPEIDAKTYQQIFQFPVEGYYQKLGFDFSEEPFCQLVAQYSQSYD